MAISKEKLEIEEENRSLGIKINVSYVTIPNEFFAGLLRKVSIANISNKYKNDYIGMKIKGDVRAERAPHE